MRTDDDSLIDGTLEAEGGAANVADGGEAVYEGSLGGPTGDLIDVADVGYHELQFRDCLEDEVIVSVNESGHEGAPVAFDNLCRCAAISGIGVVDILSILFPWIRTLESGESWPWVPSKMRTF